MTETRPPRPRSAQIDLMRAVAIVAVVLIHVWGPSTEVTPERGPLQAAFFALFVSGSAWAVPCFFFLSGLLLTQRSEFATWRDRLAWLRRRALRLLPPYLFWSAICLAVAKQADALAILRSLVCGTASYQMYFVVALVQAYVLWWLAMPWLRRQAPWAQTGATLIAVAVSVLSPVWRAVYLQSVQVDQFEWLRATVVPWIGYFALGCLVTLRFGREKGDTIPIPDVRNWYGVPFFPALLALVVLALMVMHRVTYHGPHVDHPLNTVVRPLYAFLMLFVVVALSGGWEERASGSAKRVAVALARDSYGIYLAHVLVMQLLSSYVFLQLAGLSLPLEIAYRVFALVVTVGVSWGIVRVLSLVPGVKWVSGADVG